MNTESATGTADCPAADAPWPGDLGERLRGGVGEAVNTQRGTVRVSADIRELEDSAFAAPLQLVRQLWGSPIVDPSTVQDVIDELTGILAARRPLLLAVLHSPSALMDRIPELIDEPPSAVADCWAALCWITEAAWRCVTEPPSGASSGLRLYLPLAARLRFLVLSEPFRHRGREQDPWLATCNNEPFGHNGLYDTTFGSDSWPDLLARCREARWAWQHDLDSFQSRPVLAQTGSSALEDELALLIFRTGRAPMPLILSGEPLTAAGDLTADDQAIADDIADRHLLPRFQLVRVTALALITTTRWWANWRAPLALTPVA